METLEQQKRGMLTQRVKDKSLELMGYEITIRELRLMPYVQYTLCNSQRLDNVNDEEMDILAEWVEKGYIVDGVTPNGRPMISEGVTLKVTKNFWNILNELIFLSYVDLY